MGMVHCDPVGLWVCKDQTWSANRSLRVVLRDYNGRALATNGPFEVVLVLECVESEIEMEKNFGPGPVTLLEHPKMLSNWNIMKVN